MNSERQIEYLRTNYDDTLARVFYKKSGNVGKDEQVDAQYFGNPENIGKNKKSDFQFFSSGIQHVKDHKKSAGKFFSQRYGVKVTLQGFAGDFSWNSYAGSLLNGQIGIPNMKTLKKKYKGITVHPTGIRFKKKSGKKIGCQQR